MLIVTVASLLLTGSVIWASGVLQTAPVPAPNKPIVTSEVRVIAVQPGQHTGTLPGFGELRSRNEIQLSTRVAGRVVKIYPQAERGLRVSAGTPLLQIEDVSYRMAVAEARQALADAELNLQQETQRATRARAEWEAANFDGAPTDLALRVPQLKAARQAVGAATVRLENAENDLQLTLLRAPIDAIVVNRFISRGDSLNAGVHAFELVSTDRVEARIPLSASQWSQLDIRTNQTVSITAPEGGGIWSGYVLRVEQHVDPSDRQRGLIIAVDQPLEQQPPLLPGTFITASIPTRTYRNAYRLPATALSNDGFAWWVDENLLAKIKPDQVIYLDDEILLIAQQSYGLMRFVVRPLAEFRAGLPVQPVTVTPPSATNGWPQI
ncbi:MAG: efflux RND transporter periplasmic adaptor subunit [Pseudomonadota bacterium]